MDPYQRTNQGKFSLILSGANYGILVFVSYDFMDFLHDVKRLLVTTTWFIIAAYRRIRNCLNLVYSYLHILRGDKA